MITKTFIFSLLSITNSFQLSSNRRNFLGNAIFNNNIIFSKNNPFKLPDIPFNISNIKELNTQKNLQIQKNTPDKYSHWSFYGNVPPPIKKELSYHELLIEIHNKNILTIQIAPQHDSIIATNFQGYRYACQVKDKDFEKLIDDSLDENNNLPFIVLPIDEKRQKLRRFSQAFLFNSILFYILADLDIIDYDTNSYGSWKERELAYKDGKKPKKFLKSLVDKINSKNITDITDIND